MLTTQATPVPTGNAPNGIDGAAAASSPPAAVENAPITSLTKNAVSSAAKTSESTDNSGINGENTWAKDEENTERRFNRKKRHQGEKQPIDGETADQQTQREHVDNKFENSPSQVPPENGTVKQKKRKPKRKAHRKLELKDASTQTGDNIEDGKEIMASPAKDNAAKTTRRRFEPDYKATVFVDSIVSELRTGAINRSLKDQFGSVGKVVSVNVRRTFGRVYAFIQFASEGHAEKAIETFNGTEMEGTPMHVRKAVPRGDGERKPPAHGDHEGSVPRQKSTRRDSNATKASPTVFSTEEKRLDDDEQGQVEESSTASHGIKPHQPTHRRSFNASGSDPNSNRSYNNNGNNNHGSYNGNSTRRPYNNSNHYNNTSQPRSYNPRRRPSADSPLSTTVLYVGNLPFKVTDDDLLSIFQDYSAVSAKVIQRMGRSAGFGFVVVTDEEEQRRVLGELKNVVVDGRALNILAATENQEQWKDSRDKDDDHE